MLDASSRDTPQTETIDGVRFSVVPLSSKRARRLFVRLARALGPALAVMLDGAPSLAALVARLSAGGGLADAVAKLCTSLEAEDLDAAFAEMVDTVQFSHDGAAWPYLNAANQEELFRGRMLLSLRLLAFFVQAQFRDFADALTQPHGGAAPAVGTPRS